MRTGAARPTYICKKSVHTPQALHPLKATVRTGCLRPRKGFAVLSTCRSREGCAMFAGNGFSGLSVVILLVPFLVWLIRSVLAFREAGIPFRRVFSMQLQVASPSASLHEVSIRGNADEVLRDLQLSIAGAKNTVTRRDTPDSLTAVWTHTPGWAIVVAVLLFPIGLIALVSRTSEVGTVFVNQESDGIARLRIAGVFHKTTSAAINTVIESRS